ncbi:carboxymuconolactone decarboxylase family protein [Paracoccus sanguinis]|uniref:Alkylhydroperoxidase n=1 Tax=Paracoccus sanguinis TaxID=1545044 RepID=A0A099GCN2_9RHOB|nr:carboxymuconolactone decarboxylase family protein [Paracoccus sanguinis]KGJ20489.1 alkylhydroperoxidase [Paracoccus sanguinis]
MSATEKMAEQRAMNKELSKLVPATLKGFMALEHGATKNGVLGAKEKEFIALGIAIATRCEPCIAFHVQALMRHSGTREELGDICAMAVTMGGGPSLMYGSKALAIWDELAAAA